MVGYVQKESVELTFVYLLEGSDKTHAVTNDAIPHTWQYGVYAQSVHSHTTTQAKSAIRCPTALKTVRFSNKDSAKTLSSKYMSAKCLTSTKHHKYTKKRLAHRKPL